VVYVLNPHANGASSAPALSTPPLPAKLGLIVGKSVGGSVTRHQVSRRLRAQLAARLDRVPAGSRWVVRALPAAANAGSDELGRDLDRTLNKLTTPPRQPAKLTETARQ